MTTHTTSLYIVDQFQLRFPHARSFIVKPDPRDETITVDMDGMEYVFSEALHGDNDQWVFVHAGTGVVVVFPRERVQGVPLLDENGVDVQYQRWLQHCVDDMGSDGKRITCARALHIAVDVIDDPDQSKWAQRDIDIAMGVITMIRCQSGFEHEHLTVDMDVAIYG